MEEKITAELHEPRSSAEIFADLRALAQRDGALHQISAIIYRDWVITYDTQEGRVAGNPEQRWSASKLNKNERWYVILDSIETQVPVDGLLPLVWPWKEDEVEAKNSEQVAKLFKSREETRGSQNS